MSEQFNFWFGLAIIIAGSILLIWLGKKFWLHIKGFALWLKPSFEENGKTSSKKISAFVVMTMVVIGHIAYFKSAFLNNDFSLILELFIIDFGYIATSLGIGAYTKMIEKKYANGNGKSPADTTSP